MTTVQVVRNDPAGTQLRSLRFDTVLAGYSRPGQFVTVQIGEYKANYFALASSPGQSVELLIKNRGDLAQALCALEPGQTVTMSDALGKGFPLEQVTGRELVILCNGSGISACRPVLNAEVAAGLPRPVHFYYGVLTPDRRSFLSDLERWANAGVKVHTVVGEPSGTGWRGATGFVQDLAIEHGLVRSDVGVVLVGLPIMLEQARSLYGAAGCPDSQVLVNY